MKKKKKFKWNIQYTNRSSRSYLSTDYQYPRLTTNPATDDDFVILAYHNPNYFPLINHTRTDLSLAGHTHGGQINLFGYTPRVQPASNGKQYISGLYEEDNSISCY